jgi:hypothetical protein
MADFTVNLSGTAQVDDSILQAYNKSFWLEATQAQLLDAFVDTKVQIGAESIRFTRYDALAVDADEELNEREDVDSTEMGDSKVTLSPVGVGKAVTTTELASLQTGGMIDLAAAQVVGSHMGRHLDALFIKAAQATTHATAVALDGTSLDALYVDQVEAIMTPFDGGLFVLLASEADISLIRNSSDFQDVSKYANAEGLLRNEVGIYKGHRIVRHQGVPSGKPISLAKRGMGKAVSREAGMVFTGPFDKLARFVNIGWKGTLCYGIIEANAVRRLGA